MKFSKEEKALWIEDWKQSGKGAWAYAKENGLIPQTFCNWVKREKKTVSGFVEVPANKKPQMETPSEIVIEKGEIRIRIPLPVWIECPAAIKEVLKAVAT